MSPELIPSSASFFSILLLHPIATGRVQVSSSRRHSGDGLLLTGVPDPICPLLHKAATTGPNSAPRPPRSSVLWPHAARSTGFIPHHGPSLHQISGDAPATGTSSLSPHTLRHLFCLVGPSVLPTFFLGYLATPLHPTRLTLVFSFPG